MATQVSLLVDNQAQEGLVSEHGLSIFIEHKGKRILFDNGQNEALFVNAKKLNIQLTHLDVIILSHGHYDHGGNLAYLLKTNPYADFYAHPDCLQKRYSLHPGKSPRCISLSRTDINAIKQFPVQQIHWVTQPIELVSGLWLSGQIPRLSSFEDTGGPFFLDSSGHYADLLNDDMCLWIETSKGLVVVCGCCHSGIVNTLAHIEQHYLQASQTLPKIEALIGGLHLLNADELRIKQTITYLNQRAIAFIYPAHCSGDQAVNIFQEQLNSQTIPTSAGLSLNW